MPQYRRTTTKWLQLSVKWTCYNSETKRHKHALSLFEIKFMSPIFLQLKIQLPYPTPPKKKCHKSPTTTRHRNYYVASLRDSASQNVTNDSGRPASQKQSRSNFEPFTATTMRWLKTSQPKPHGSSKKVVEGKAPVLMEFFFKNLQWWSGLYLEPKWPLFWLEKTLFWRVEAQK